MSVVDNRTHLNDCEDDAENFTTSGAQLGTESVETGLIFQGSASVDVQFSDNNDEVSTSEDSAAATFDVDMSDMTLYVVVKDNLVDTFEQSVGGNGGMQIVIDDATNRIGYPVGGSNARGLPLRRQFNALKLDVAEVVASAPGNEAVYAGTEASLTQTSIHRMGYGALHSSKSAGAIPNLWLDGLYYIANSVSATTGFAASIQGGSSGTPETMSDVVGDDETAGVGLFNNPKGSEYGFFGPTQWGGAVADSYFTATDEQWYFIGDNSGGHPVGATHFPFTLTGDSGQTNSWVITRVTIVNVGTRAEFDMSNVDMDFVQLVNCTLIDLGAITMPANDVDKFCNGGTFINGAQMILSSLDMDGNTWIGTTDANGAIIWDATVADQEKQVNGTFVRVGTHNAIEINPTGAGPFTYDVDGLIVDGFASQDDAQATETEKVFFINPVTLSADININLSNSSAINIGLGNADDTGIEGFSYREVGSYTGTVTITQTVTLSVTVSDADDAALLEDVFVSIRNAATNALISEGRTNASGLYQDTGYNYTGDLAVTINVRKSSPGDTRYFPKADGNTIISTGMSAVVQLSEDTTAGVIASATFDISKHGQISSDVSGAAITAKIKLPSGTRRKLVVAGFYWDSTVNRTVTTFTYDGGGMTDTGGGNFVQEGSNFHEVFLYRHDIPDSDSGTKDVVLTLSGDANFRAIAFAVINLAATGAEEDDGNSVGQAVTTNPSISLNNTTQPAIDVMFSLTDDLDTFPPAATGVGSIRRADRAVDTEKQITIIRADRITTGAHSIGADYDAASKSYVSAAATFAD